MRHLSKLVALAAFAALSIGCQSSGPQADNSAQFDGNPSPQASQQIQEPARPWTTAFNEEAVLIADQILIEGPPGILNHVAMAQNPRDFDLEVKATEKGLRQETKVKPELAQLPAVSWPPLRAQLDNLTIAVTHRAVVIERPTYVDVKVIAQGNVLWKMTRGLEEKRGERLILRGSGAAQVQP